MNSPPLSLAPTDASSAPPTPRPRALLAAAGASLFVALLLLATSHAMPLVWDEGDTIERAESIDTLRPNDEWPFTISREGHPPLAFQVVRLGMRWAPESWDPLTRARFGPILLFSLAAGAMFYRLQRTYALWVVSLTALAALLTMPRLFAHAHFATLDAPLAACWLLAWATFAPASRDWRWTPLFGLALGLTFSAKFTGWLAPLPFLAWALLGRDRRALVAVVGGIAIAVAVFVALNPPLHDHPLDGLRTFFELNLNRGARPEHNISTQFLGRMYNLDFPLPWYNTLVWTAITVSPMPLVFGVMGVWTSLRRWRTDRASLLLACQWTTLIVARALPWAPPHDAERLILPSFVFFAALVGVGMGRALYRETLLSADKIPAQGWAKVALVFVVGASLFDSVAYFPHGLSYYNRLVGGLRGATSLGMEPTYYWDSLDRPALDWLAEHTKTDEKVAFASAPPANLRLLKRWGQLAKLPSDPGTFRWYVLQRRPSAQQPVQLWLIEHETPAYESRLAGVPLLDIYSYEQFERATAEAQPK